MKEKIKALVLRYEQDLKKFKATLRDPAKQPPETMLYVHLREAKWDVTTLYMAIAMSRGRLHQQFTGRGKYRKAWTLEDQAKYVDEHLPDLLEPEVAA